jgi:general secretion pathway protein D
MKKLIHFCSLLFICVGTFSSLAAPVDDQNGKEAKRREQMLQPLEAAYRGSAVLAREGRGVEACKQLEKAYLATPDALRDTALGRQVRQTLAKLQASLAESAAQNNNWPEARKWALASLRYEPANEKATEQLRASEEILRRGTQGNEPVNPALTTNFFDRLGGVRTGLEEAEAFRETGQLGEAERRYEDVLRLDPFNSVATEGIRKIYQERALVADKVRDLSNLERKREVREAWNNIYPTRGEYAGGINIAGPMTASATYDLEMKLQSTIIPQIDFADVDLEGVRKSLVNLSRTYDPGPEKTGVNFVVSSDIIDSKPINLKLKQVSLAEVVRYVAEIAGVKARRTEVGINFSPVVENRSDLITRSFTVNTAFFESRALTDNSLAPKGASLTDESKTSSSQNEQAKLEALGVKFPKGAYAIYNKSTCQLRVANSAEMLDLIGQLISAAEEEALLIQVGVRLVEINQSDLDSITANSTLGGSGINLLSPVPQGLIPGSNGDTPGGSKQVGVNAQLNQIQGVGLLPNNTLQSFLQNGVLAGTNQASSYALNTMDLGGTILNGMQLRAMITAISQKNSANVLANPSIVLQRGHRGNIQVVQEFRYVKEYNAPQSSIRTFVPAGSGTQTAVPGPETVIGSFPSTMSDKDENPLGITMGVEPDITGNRTRVLLKLFPTFVDFEGFINYGTQINSAYAATYFDSQVTILTNNIQQPVFIRRDVSVPQVEVSDGYTLLLGGLLREDIQTIDEKVPLIGDVPLFGRAFQGKTKQAIKKNTLIFVTPRILRVDGQPLNPTAGAPTTASLDTPVDTPVNPPGGN